MPPVESADDLASFFVADEFGTEATVQTTSGPVAVVGIIDSEADTERPGTISRSSGGPFMVGASDASISKLQFLTQFYPLAAARADNTLTIADGPYAGNYRIRDIQRDGEVCRLLLNKAP